MVKAHVPSLKKTNRIECRPYSLRTLLKNDTKVRQKRMVSNATDGNLKSCEVLLSIA